MSFTGGGGRRRDHAPLLQPLMGSSPPSLSVGPLAQHHPQQHFDRQQRAQSAGISPANARAPPGRFPSASRGAGAAAKKPVIVSDQQQAARQKDKWVPLPEEEDEDEGDMAAAEAAAAASTASAAAAASFAGTAVPSMRPSEDAVGGSGLSGLSDASASLDDGRGSGGLPAAAAEALEAAWKQQQIQQQQHQLRERGAADEDTLSSLCVSPGIFSDVVSGPVGLVQVPPSRRGRITLYCNAESFDRKKLHEVLHASFHPGAIRVYPDVFYVQYASSTDEAPGADVYFFDYGVVCCWGLDATQETSIIQNIARHAQGSTIEADEMEVDQFEFNVSSTERPHIINDTVTLHRKAARDHRVKLAISYALSQSTKLSLYERRVVDMVLETKHLPEELAKTGEVPLTPEDLVMMAGKVFIQRAAVNLLSSVLDTPEFFWREADSYQALYNRICEYLEMPERVEVLNARFTVLQEMLDMLRDHENNHHQQKMELIVIWLIGVCVVVGLTEVAGLFGWFK